MYFRDGTSNPGTTWQLEAVTNQLAPEPGVLMLLATGLIGLLAYAWRKRR